MKKHSCFQKQIYPVICMINFLLSETLQLFTIPIQPDKQSGWPFNFWGSSTSVATVIVSIQPICPVETIKPNCRSESMPVPNLRSKITIYWNQCKHIFFFLWKNHHITPGLFKEAHICHRVVKGIIKLRVRFIGT